MASEFKKYVKSHKPKTLTFESQGDYYYGGMKEGWIAALKWVLYHAETATKISKEIQELERE